MKVAVLLWRRVTFFTTYLNHMRLSAIVVRVENFIPISHCPADATSWWPTSTSIPLSVSVVMMSARRSWSTSVGGTGKYPSLWRTLWPRFGPALPVFHAASSESSS